MRTRHLISLLVAIPVAFGLLSACDTTASLVDLRNAPPPADPYVVSLSGMYRDYAEAEVAKYDWWTSQHFADKGLALTQGKEIEPEKLSDWDIPDDQAEEFTRARASLLEALTPEAKEAHPDDAASAMFHFDCWVEKTDGGWQTEDIAACRDHFHTALAVLQNKHAEAAPVEQAEPEETTEEAKPAEAKKPVAAKPVKEERKPAPAKKEERRSSKLPTVSSSTVLYFPFDASTLDGKLKHDMDNLIASLKAHPGTQLVINGHADRVGTDNYNLDLSAKRAEYIEKLLIARGLDPKRVEYFAFGESDPAVPTADGVRSQANRRVEIFLE